MPDMYDCGRSTRIWWALDTRGTTWLRRTLGPYRDDVTREEVDRVLEHDKVTPDGVAAFWRGWEAAGPQTPAQPAIPRRKAMDHDG